MPSSNESRRYPELPGGISVAWSALPSRHSFPQQLLRISGDRTWKRPLTRPRKPFAVWQRLSFDSPASPRGPFMVELFTAIAFDDGPRTGQSGSACCQARSSPRRPGCTKSSRTPEPPGRDYAQRSHRARRLTRFVRWRPETACCFRHVRIAPARARGELSHRIEHQDYSSRVQSEPD